MDTTAGKNRPKRPTAYLLPFLGFFIVLLVWDGLVRISGWSRQVFPGPVTVLVSMGELLADGSLVRHTVASLFRVTVGFYLAAILGIPLGIALGTMRTARSMINPLIQFLRPISPLAWIPLAMLWFGIGDPPAVFLIFLSSFFPLAVSTTIAVDAIHPTYFHVASNFNFSRTETIFRLVVPAILPEVVTALRMTVTISWLVVVAAEMLAVQSGLGFLILDARNALRMDYVMDGMLIIGLVGLILDALMRRLGDLDLVGWRRMTP
ncbi:MAG: ABC transporter permease [Desulfosarcina sp.]